MDWGGAIGVLATVVGIIFLHIHDKLKTPAGRAEIIADMQNRDWATAYAKHLEGALTRLRQVAGGPGSMQSLGFCMTLALVYALLAALAGWGGGGGGALGAVPLFARPDWVPAVVPDWLVAALTAATLALVGLSVFPIVRLLERHYAKLTAAGRPVFGGIAGALALAGALVFALAGAGALALALAVAVAVIGPINASDVAFFVLMAVLPLINAVSDYVSLGFSHWFGLRIVRDETHSVRRALGWAAADVGLALLFMGLAALTIPMALAAVQLASGVDLDPRGFVTEAACDPWGAGLWFGIMILTTLAWTIAHLLIAVVGFAVRLYDGFPLDTWAARVVEAGRDSLRVKAYLSLKGVLAIGVCAVLVWGGFEAVNELVHGAASLAGADTGAIGLLEIVAHTGVDWVLGAPAKPTPSCR